MSGRIPKGADLLADVRRQGFRPSVPVFVFVDANRRRSKIYSDAALDVEICIKPTDRLEEIDLWPLRDLDVLVHGIALDDRLRAVLKLIVKQAPQVILGAVPAENLVFCWRPGRAWEFDHVR
jgi:hypothetical protein